MGTGEGLQHADRRPIKALGLEVNLNCKKWPGPAEPVADPVKPRRLCLLAGWEDVLAKPLVVVAFDVAAGLVLANHLVDTLRFFVGETVGGSPGAADLLCVLPHDLREVTCFVVEARSGEIVLFELFGVLRVEDNAIRGVFVLIVLGNPGGKQVLAMWTTRMSSGGVAVVGPAQSKVG